MPLRDHMHLISVDDHVIEHPRVWSSRLPARWRELGPCVVEVDHVVDQLGQTRDGLHEVWLYEGRTYAQVALNAVAGWPQEQYGLEPFRLDQIRPGCYDPVARIADMDVAGVHAQLCFPSFPGFAGRTFHESDDKELAAACVRAYNDFILEEWCASAPQRLIPMVILPFWDVEASVAEIRRCADLGARAVSFPDAPHAMGLPSFYSPHWHPVLAALQDADMAMCMHFGSAGATPVIPDDAPYIVAISLMGTGTMATLATLLLSPVFHTFPHLRFAMSEGGIGWVPYLLERIDYTWERHRHYLAVDRSTRPSDVFRRNVWGCFIDDEHGVRARHDIGVERITWECDYPHSDTTWPDARKRLGELLEDVPDEEAHRIVELNARELFRFPRTGATASSSTRGPANDLEKERSDR